jgi:hypothetical protein
MWCSALLKHCSGKSGFLNNRTINSLYIPYLTMITYLFIVLCAILLDTSGQAEKSRINADVYMQAQNTLERAQD